MKKILYIGNKLSHHGYSKGVIETLGPQLQSVGYHVYYAGERLNPLLRLLEMLVRLYKYRNKVSYVLIDTYCTHAFWFAFLSGLLARILSIKYITILHGGNIPTRIRNSKMASDCLFKHSFANVAVSGYLKKAFIDAGYKAMVIRNNIDISKYPFILRDKPGPKLLWVRSFHKIYNPNMSVDVLENILKEYPNAQLCMVGSDIDGSMELFRDYARQKGILDRIRITGVLSKEAWIKLAADYDFFINTTNVDNTPVSVIEAMALGLCVVSTKPGGIPFILTDNENARLVNLNDAVQMAQIIKYLINNVVSYQYMIVNARNATEKLDWEIVKHQWIELLA